MARVVTFDKALAQAVGKKHLLIGNGFSIALFPKIFSYHSLLATADFAGRDHLKALFGALGTSDFEVVIRALKSAVVTGRIYGGDLNRIADDVDFLKELLVSTVASNHPALPSEISIEQYRSARRFLSHFDHKFTLNYDLVVYWTQMQQEVDDLGLNGADDGFRDPGYDADHVIWDDHNSANTLYLHGALHLFDDGAELQKYTWSRTNVPLMDQIRAALNKNAFPLFVAEGSSREKLTRINHSGYLHRSYRSFRTCTGSLFVFGHSFGGDEHILGELSKARSRYDALYVSIYGDPNTATNQEIMAKAQQLSVRRKGKKPLEVVFFDAESAKVWG